MLTKSQVSFTSILSTILTLLFIVILCNVKWSWPKDVPVKWKVGQYVGIKTLSPHGYIRSDRSKKGVIVSCDTAAGEAIYTVRFGTWTERRGEYELEPLLQTEIDEIK